MDAERVAAAREGRCRSASPATSSRCRPCSPTRCGSGCSSPCSTPTSCASANLALALGVSEGSTSDALTVLRSAGLVQRRAEGRMGYDRLADGEPCGVLAPAVEQLRLPPRLHLERMAEDD